MRVVVSAGLHAGDVARITWAGGSGSATYDGTPTIARADAGCGNSFRTGMVSGTKSPKATKVQFADYAVGPIDATTSGGPVVLQKPSSLTVSPTTYAATFVPGGFGSVTIDEWMEIGTDIAVNSTAGVGGLNLPPICQPSGGGAHLIAVGGRKVQKLGRTISATVTALRPVWATLSGRVRLRGKVLRLAGVENRYIAPGHATTLRARLSRTQRRAIRKALDHHRRISARLMVKARDTLGAVAAVERKVKLAL